MSSTSFGKDELIDLFKHMKLTQKKIDEGIQIYEENYEKAQNLKNNKKRNR